jgi:hypothetical protein
MDTTSYIDNPTLCIPRVDISTPSEYIFKKMCKLNWGYIQKIIEIPMRNDPYQKRIIVKLKWNNNQETIEYKEKIKKGESIKVVHSPHEPWFWKIVQTEFKPTKN